MSFKREMAVAREYSKQYLEQPFEYALTKSVIVLCYLLARLLNSSRMLAER